MIDMKNDADSTNFSPFISSVFATDFVFDSCVMNANYKNFQYGAAFLGGYSSDKSTIIFRNCVNKGDLSGGEVGVITGGTLDKQDHRAFTYTVENCRNEGSIYGTTYAGFYNGMVADYDGNSLWTWILKDNVIGDISFSQSSSSGVTVEATGSDNHFVIRSTSSEYSSFALSGSVYASLYNASGDKSGTLLVIMKTPVLTPENGEITTEFSKLDIIDVKGLTEAEKNSITTDAYGNSIVTKDGQNYYVNDGTGQMLTPVVGSAESGYIASLTYSLTCYDKDGTAVVQIKL